MTDPKLVDLLSGLIEVAAIRYEKDWTPERGDEMVVPQIMVFVDKEYATLPLPLELSIALFNNPATKANIASSTIEYLAKPGCPLLALLVVSETWFVHQEAEEAKARKASGGDVRSVPGAKTAFMGIIYTKDGSKAYIQPMENAKRSGPVKRLGGEGSEVVGNLVGKPDEPAGESEA